MQWFLENYDLLVWVEMSPKRVGDSSQQLGDPYTIRNNINLMIFIFPFLGESFYYFLI